MASTPDRAAQVSLGEIDRIVAGTHHDPHSVLGAHPAATHPAATHPAATHPAATHSAATHAGPDGGVIVRALRPLAKSVAVVLPDGTRFPMDHVHEGVFAVTLPAQKVPDYRLAVSYPGPDGGTLPETLTDDPYRHLPTLGEVDLYLIGEGRHEQLWEVLGAHVHRPDGTAPAATPGFEPVVGTSFAVWAPNARGVRLLGDFNHWDGRGHPMRSLGGAGIWEIYLPGAGEGARYKFDVCAPDGQWRRKADPMANLAERPPATASVVYRSDYEWGDGDWLAARAQGERSREPVSIYEVHLGSWRPGLSYTDLAEELTGYVARLGFTHVEFLPVAEHPFGGSMGLPGDLVLRADRPIRDTR